MSNHTKFVTTPGGGGGVYKPRVWVHNSHMRTDVGQFLSRCSIWRGYDKSFGEWIAYECRQESLDKACEYLIAQGFQKTDNLDGDEVW